MHVHIRILNIKTIQSPTPDGATCKRSRRKAEEWWNNVNNLKWNCSFMEQEEMVDGRGGE